MSGTHLGRKAKVADAKELRVMIGKAGVPVAAVDHGGLVGLTDDDHTQYVHIGSNRTITAQHTIAPTSAQPPFVLGANALGQTVIGLRADQLNKSVTAGNGLTGGGALTSNVSLALTTPGTLTHATTNNAAGNHTHAITTSANPGAAASILQSDSSGFLRLVGMGIGATPALNSLMLPTGGTVGSEPLTRISFDSSNDRVEVRTHLRLTDGGANAVDFLYNTGGLLTIDADGDIELGPGGNDVLPTTNYEKNLGFINRKWLTIHAAELWVQTLVAQEVVATIGGRIVVAPTTVLAANLVAASPSVVTKHNQARRQDILYMEGGGKVEFMRVDSLAITTVDSSNEKFMVSGNHASAFVGGHTLFVVESIGGVYDGSWTIVSAVYNGGLNRTEITVAENITSLPAGGYILYTAPAASTAPFTYLNVARNLDGSGANDWFAGDAVVNLGMSGDGFIDIYSTNGVTAGSTFGPTIVGNVRNSTTYNDWNEAWAIGNLNGLYGYSANTYGVGLGKYANGAAHITVDPSSGIQMKYRSGGVNTTTGLWLPGGDIILGPIATNKANLFWDVSEGRLNIRGGNLGIEVAAYIDQDGSVVAGDGDVVMNQEGLTFLNIPTSGLIAGDPVALKFNYGTSNEVVRFDVYEQEISGTAVETNIDIVSKTVSNATGKRAAIYLRAHSGVFGNSTAIRLETTHNSSTAQAIRFELASVNFATFKANDLFTTGGILIGGGGDGSVTAPEDGYLVFYNGGSYRKLRVNGTNLEFWNGLAWKVVAFV